MGWNGPSNNKGEKVTIPTFYGEKMMDHHGFEMTIRNPETQLGVVPFSG